MNFKEWLIINESKEEKALALELAGNQDNYNELLKVIPQNQKDSDPLILLAAYYLTQSKNLNQTKQDIQDYIQLLKNNKMPLIKVDLNKKSPPIPFDKYIYWTEIIHGHQAEEQAKQAKKYIPSDVDFQNEKPITTSTDGLIKVYQSNSPNQCIILGKGQSFCVSQPGNTMWKSYRDTQGSTFYFVYDDSRQDNLSIVVVDAKTNGIELTDRVNTTGRIQNPDNPNQKDTNPKIYMNYLKSKGIDTNIFKNLPKTKEEIEEDEKLGNNNQDLSWFVKLSPQEKSNYIGRGHQLSDEQFDYLLNNKFYSLLEQYVKTGLKLNNYQIDKIATNKDLKNNYIHNRLIALQHKFNINKKEWDLLNDQQKDKLAQIPNAVEKAVNNFEIAKYLIDKGAEIGDAVEYAAENGNLELVKYLIDKGGKIGKAVNYAASSGNLELIKYLVDKGGKIGMAVDYAAYHNDVDLVKYLIDKGGEIGKAVNYAAGSGNLELVKYLVDKGGEIGKAVKYAAESGHLNVVKYLIDKGGKIGNAVEYAARSGNIDLVKYLIDKGGKISDHAVTNAAASGNLELVKYLIDKGGEIRRDALDIATNLGHHHIVKYFNDL